MEKPKFKYDLGAYVRLLSDEEGCVIGRSESLDYGIQYHIRYTAGDGRLVEQWWPESAIAT